MPVKGHCPQDTTGDAQVFLGGGVLAPEVKLAAVESEPGPGLALL